MYPTRIILRPQQGHRVAKAAPSLCRGMASSFHPTPFWGAPRFPSSSAFGGASELAPFFRMFDDATRAFDSLPGLFDSAEHAPVWQPRFDVREAENAYELRGELPGVDASALEVQFTDPTTLVIRGKTEAEHSAESKPAAAAPAAAPAADTAATTAADAASDAASVHSESSYVQPTVEDEAEAAGSEAGTSTTAPAQHTPAESAVAPAETAPAPAPEKKERFWLSERRTGSFQRTFSFAKRIDADAVTASLKNGILNVTVPKAAAPEVKRIAIQ